LDLVSGNQPLPFSHPLSVLDRVPFYHGPLKPEVNSVPLVLPTPSKVPIRLPIWNCSTMVSSLVWDPQPEQLLRPTPLSSSPSSFPVNTHHLVNTSKLQSVLLRITTLIALKLLDSLLSSVSPWLTLPSSPGTPNTSMYTGDHSLLLLITLTLPSHPTPTGSHSCRSPHPSLITSPDTLPLEELLQESGRIGSTEILSASPPDLIHYPESMPFTTASLNLLLITLSPVFTLVSISVNHVSMVITLVFKLLTGSGPTFFDLSLKLSTHQTQTHTQHTQN